MSFLNNYCCEHFTMDDEIASRMYREIQLERLKNLKYDPLVSINPFFIPVPYEMLPLDMRIEFKKEHHIFLSFEDFLKDYLKHPMYYKILRALEEKNG